MSLIQEESIYKICCMEGWTSLEPYPETEGVFLALGEDGNVHWASDSPEDDAEKIKKVLKETVIPDLKQQLQVCEAFLAQAD